MRWEVAYSQIPNLRCDWVTAGTLAVEIILSFSAGWRKSNYSSADLMHASRALAEFIQTSVKNKNSDSSAFYYILSSLQCEEPQPQINSSTIRTRWLQAFTHITSHLSHSDYMPFVDSILEFPDWHTQDDSYYESYVEFLENLVSAHSHFISTILFRIVTLIRFPNKSQACCLDNLQLLCFDAGDPSPVKETSVARLQESLLSMIHLIPLSSSSVLLPLLQSNFPYPRDSLTAHAHYVSQLLWVSDAIPLLRGSLLKLIVERCVALDADVAATPAPDSSCGGLKTEENLELSGGQKNAFEQDLTMGDETDTVIGSDSELDFSTSTQTRIVQDPHKFHKLRILIASVMTHLQHVPSNEVPYRDLMHAWCRHLLPCLSSTRFTGFVYFWLCSRDPHFSDSFVRCLMFLLFGNQSQIEQPLDSFGDALCPTTACHTKFTTHQLLEHFPTTLSSIEKQNATHLHSRSSNTLGIVAASYRVGVASFLASLLARARFIGIRQCAQILKISVSWLHAYLDQKQSAVDRDVWFGVTEMVLHVFTLRWKEFLGLQRCSTLTHHPLQHSPESFFIGDDLLTQSLMAWSRVRGGLDRILSSPLQPLHHISRQTAESFERISRHVELVYCACWMPDKSDVVENNHRHTHRFPLDPHFRQLQLPVSLDAVYNDPIETMETLCCW